LLRRAGLTALPTGIAHGTVTALVPQETAAASRHFSAKEAQVEGAATTARVPIEITTFRADGTYSDGRHPDAVTFVSSIEEDLARRDITINAMAYHPARGLRDPFAGAQDLAQNVVRAVGDPRRRLKEDALRLLRVVRFAARFDATIEPATAAAVRLEAPALTQVASERVGAELDALLRYPQAPRYLRAFPELFAVAVPELAALQGFDQKSPYHVYDVWEHTLQVLGFVQIEAGGVVPPALAWAALLHDVAKPATLTVDARGRGHFYGHPSEGARMAAKIMQRLALPAELKRDALALIRLHDRPTLPTKRSVRSILRDLDHYAPGRAPALSQQLITIKRADALAKAPACRPYAVELDEVSAVMRSVLASGDAYCQHTLAITGGDVVALGVVPLGPEVGATLARALDAVIEGRLPNEKPVLLQALLAGDI
jgi:tRNA nucleotidyltransferase (CCA-adding enzyme)